MKPTNLGILGVCLLTLASFGTPALKFAQAQSANSGQDAELAEGKRLFRADCAGCHKWHGGGGGGYGGAALSLRNTHLSRDQIIETVGCGRPGTGNLRLVFRVYRDFDSHLLMEITAALPVERTEVPS